MLKLEINDDGFINQLREAAREHGYGGGLMMCDARLSFADSLSFADATNPSLQ